MTVLWPIMVAVTEREAVSVSSLRDRLSRQGWVWSRRAVRRRLKRLARYGILVEHCGHRALFCRPDRWRMANRGS